MLYLEEWMCGEGQFECGQANPKCLSQAQVCNDYQDCSDGRDELAGLCGERDKDPI